MGNSPSGSSAAAATPPQDSDDILPLQLCNPFEDPNYESDLKKLISSPLMQLPADMIVLILQYTVTPPNFWVARLGDLFSYLTPTTPPLIQRVGLQPLGFCVNMVRLRNHLFLFQGQRRVLGFDIITQKTFDVPPMIYTHSDGGRAVMMKYTPSSLLNEHVICMGGTKDPGRGYVGRPTRAVSAYNVRTHKWFSLPKMTIHRRYPACVTYDGYVYAFGGWKYPVVASCERLDTNNKTFVRSMEWRAIADMQNPRATAVAAVITDIKRIWVAGGNGTHKVVWDNIEEYDPEHDTWKLLSIKLPAKLAFLEGMVYHQQFLFIVSGDCIWMREAPCWHEASQWIELTELNQRLHLDRFEKPHYAWCQ